MGEDLCRCSTWLTAIGLGHLNHGRRVASLSGGERRRLALGRLLHGKTAAPPDLVVLDEPSRGLSALDRPRLMVLLRELAANGVAVVYAEHALDMIMGADQVLELGPGSGGSGGQVVFQGSPEKLATAATATGRAVRAAGVQH